MPKLITLGKLSSNCFKKLCGSERSREVFPLVSINFQAEKPEEIKSAFDQSDFTEIEDIESHREMAKSKVANDSSTA
jgi:hypothetical protein